VIVTGASGLVGRAVVSHCAAQGERVTALDHSRLDIANESSVKAAFDHEAPDVVINCGAWTDVDGCELDPQRAQVVNAHGPELLALECRRVGALLIAISTDYVFDGEKEGFYTQRDQPNPQSVYAASKLDGERRAQISWARTIIVRSGYIFGVGGKNFLSSIIARARCGERLLAINDMSGTPTYAPDLARRLHQLAQLDLPGTYHVVNGGEGVTFESFARGALAIANLDPDLVRGIGFDTLKRPATRPRNSKLRCLLSEAIGLEPLPHWEHSVRDFITAEGRAGVAEA
jgi:dTDP-4-dehydrorhamnose reductase